MSDWATYYMGFAQHAATKSKDSTKVGAVIVRGYPGQIISTGFNGPPRGVLDTPERLERPTKYLFACHAEANAIAFAARGGGSTEACQMFVTHHPCSSCMKLIIQAGISIVTVGDGKTSMPDEEFTVAAIMAKEAGVRVTRL